MPSSLEQYFKYKSEYLQKYSKYKEFKLFDVTSTNMPIHFYETDKKYIVEVIDPDNRDIIYYRKTIPNPSNVINLSYLHDKLKNDLDKMNVDYNKENYLTKINQLEKEKNDLISINNTLLQPDQNINLKLTNIDNEIQLLTSTFTEWLKSVEQILIQMEIIQDIYNNKIQNDNNNINEYSIKYHWLHNKINSSNNDSHFIIIKLYTQGVIKNINDIIKYANDYYIIKSISSTSVNIQNIRTANIIDISITDIIHEAGSYIIYKDYSLSNGTIVTNTDVVYKFNNETDARFVLSQLTYQEEKWSEGHIVMYNNNWYKINSINGSNIKIQTIDDVEILDVNKDTLIHPIGYRQKYTKINQTDELILPVNKWIDTFSNTNQYYINNKELYQGPELKKNGIVRYNDNWHVVISVTAPTVTIRNLENKTDINPKTVSINDVTYKEGYYNKYKNFKYTTNLIIPIDEWANTIKSYNILLEDTDLTTETTEYPANDMSNRYLRKDTDIINKEETDRKQKLLAEKKAAKLAAMTEEEKQALLLKKEKAKETAKEKRATTLKVDKKSKEYSMELQEELFCGKHALNNLFGCKLLINDSNQPNQKIINNKLNLAYICSNPQEYTDYLPISENTMIEDCDIEKGNYSAQFIGAVMHELKDMKIITSFEGPIFQDIELKIEANLIGYLVNLINNDDIGNHWISIKVEKDIDKTCDSRLVLYDSLEKRPICIKNDEFNKIKLKYDKPPVFFKIFNKLDEKIKKKSDSNKNKIKTDNAILSSIKLAHNDYINRVNEVQNDSSEFKKLIIEVTNYAKKINATVTENKDKEAKLYITNVLLPDIQKWVTNYKQLTNK
jgi:hypothetical protein